MPQQSNRIGVNQGNKVVIDDYAFNSKQEADFYMQFVRNCKHGYQGNHQ